jgi:hypothetical protein
MRQTNEFYVLRSYSSKNRKTKKVKLEVVGRFRMKYHRVSNALK